MAAGLSIPIGVDQNGRAKIDIGTAQDTKVLRLALGSDTNENAYQQKIGLGDSMVFGTNDEYTQIQILARLRRIFEKFAQLKRFKLREETVAWERVDGDMTLSFKYVNLEADEERDFRSSFGAGAGIGGS